MSISTSTEVRANLKKYLMAAQRHDIFINMNDEYVATLTCDEPEITAMRLKITEAKSNWADIIALVMYQNAVFKFKLLDHNPVYLIKDSDLECSLLDRWLNHERENRLIKIKAGSIDELKIDINDVYEQLDALKEAHERTNDSIRCFFRQIKGLPQT
ncbi:MAG: hypothetical protein WCK96_14095 [Methylococcales bacterium]